jgi:hypothetical protein
MQFWLWRIGMTSETEELQNKIQDINALVKSGIITDQMGQEWKDRIIADFGKTKIPGAPLASGAEEPKDIMQTTDLGHLPGRIIGKSIPVLKGFLAGCGATYKGLSEQEGYDTTLPGQGRKEGGKPKQRPKSPEEMYNDIPEQFR